MSLVAVRDALDLCLACKGCKADCPANADMATYKAEFLARHWAGRQWRRPRSDLSLGWLPVLSQHTGPARNNPGVAPQPRTRMTVLSRIGRPP